MGAYQPSNAVSIARSAGTTVNSIAIEIHGTEAAVPASGASAVPAAGAARKQPTTRIMSIRPIETLMIEVSELPIRRPTQWMPVKAAMSAMASARGFAAAAGHRAPKNVTAVIDT